MTKERRMALPKDLKAYGRKKILQRVLPCALMFVSFGLILLEWGTVIFATRNKIFLISCYVVVMILPFVLTGVPHKLIDKTYYGIVKKVDIVTTIDNGSSVKPTREHLYLKNTIYLKIETSNGELIYKKAYSGKAKLLQNIHTYNEGDKVFHLYGTNVTIVLPGSADISVQCTVCGTSNNINDDKCRDCGHSLVKSI